MLMYPYVMPFRSLWSSVLLLLLNYKRNGGRIAASDAEMVDVTVEERGDFEDTERDDFETKVDITICSIFSSSITHYPITSMLKEMTLKLRWI